MNWLTDHLLQIGGVRFLLVTDPAELHRQQSEGGRFVLGKTRSMVERIHALGKTLGARRILEIGIFKGGSTVLYDKLFAPDRLVAVDLSATPVAALAEYVAANRREGAVRPHYGVNQDDSSRLRELLDANFPDRTLDLVVDDASHFYEETKASFNASFPYLRDGGIYAIEDWAWAHWPPDLWQEDGGLWKDKPAMSNLAVELIMACASAPHLVRTVKVLPTLLVVERGEGAAEPGRFDVSKTYLNRGREFNLPL